MRSCMPRLLRRRGVTSLPWRVAVCGAVCPGRPTPPRQMAADKVAAAADAEADAEEADILAGMGLSAEEAASAAEKVQAIQRGKLARRQVRLSLRTSAGRQLLPAANCCRQPTVAGSQPLPASCCQQPAVGSSCCRHPIVASSQLLSAASQRQPTRVGCWLG